DERWTAEWDASHWPVSDMGSGWVDEFHVWEMEWTEQNMSISLDGSELNTVSLADTINGSSDCAGENPFQQPHYLLLNLALGSAGGSVADLEFPTYYLVDYVRVYQ
ncbi:MAG: family 16 glycosylhydrolase, partial [Myxococcota bacterium]|nr:family 16 glycosylhydrolase [Myxococcota bacterium]